MFYYWFSSAEARHGSPEDQMLATLLHRLYQDVTFTLQGFELIRSSSIYLASTTLKILARHWSEEHQKV